MNTLLVFLAVSSFIFAFFSGNMGAVSASAVEGCADAVFYENAKNIFSEKKEREI